MPYDMVMLILCGFCSGIMGASVGMGGASLFVALSSLITSLPFATISAASFFCILLTSVASSTWDLPRGQIHLLWANRVESTSLIFGFLGSVLIPYIPTTLLLTLLAGITSTTALKFLRPQFHTLLPSSSPATSSPVCPSPSVCPQRQYSLAFIITTISGASLLSGLLGISGGLMFVPILHSLAKLPIQQAVSSCSYAVATMAMGGLSAHLLRESVVWPVCMTAGFGVLLGSRLGTIIGQRATHSTLRHSVAWTLVILSGLLWFKILK